MTMTMKMNVENTKFCLMVAGETGLGKSTLLNSLFTTDHLEAEETPKRTLGVTTKTLEVEEGGVHREITLVDTPGLGDAMDSSGCYQFLIKYIDQQFKR